MFPNFGKREEIKALIERLECVKVHIEQSRAEKEATFRDINQSWFIDLNFVISRLKSVMPYAVCPYCQGRTFDQCLNCGHTGFVGDFFFNHTVPKEIREMRMLQVEQVKAYRKAHG